MASSAFAASICKPPGGAPETHKNPKPYSEPLPAAASSLTSADHEKGSRCRLWALGRACQDFFNKQIRLPNEGGFRGLSFEGFVSESAGKAQILAPAVLSDFHWVLSKGVA